jgi:putative redox protein
MPAEVIVRSVQGTKHTQEVKAGSHLFFGDEPESVGGADRGPTPYEYLLTALGT